MDQPMEEAMALYDRRFDRNDRPVTERSSFLGTLLPFIIAAAIAAMLMLALLPRSDVGIRDTSVGPSVKTVTPQPTPSTAPMTPGPSPTTGPRPTQAPIQ
jgi:hypothetical protein